MAAVVVELGARKFAIPQECPCCGAPPDAELRIPGKGQHQELDFPYCKRCVAHAAAWDSAGVGSAGVMVLAIAGAVFAAIKMTILVAVGIFVVGATVAWILQQSRRAAAKARCGESCAATGRAVEYLGWTGSSRRFSFASPTFAARFAEANQAALANVAPQLRKLIDGYHKARLAVPTPAVAAGIAPPPLTGPDWIKRIETTEGTLARRVMLSRALEMIEEPQPRRELIQTVARIELAPLLDKLQRQSSPAAKRTLLAFAIARIKIDNIPDELEAAELEKLEARLAELV
jgi:hypothetical protein